MNGSFLWSDNRSGITTNDLANIFVRGWLVGKKKATMEDIIDEKKVDAKSTRSSKKKRKTLPNEEERERETAAFIMTCDKKYGRTPQQPSWNKSWKKKENLPDDDVRRRVRKT